MNMNFSLLFITANMVLLQMIRSNICFGINAFKNLLDQSSLELFEKCKRSWNIDKSVPIACNQSLKNSVIDFANLPIDLGSIII